MKGKRKNDINVEGSGEIKNVREGEKLKNQWGDEMVRERERLEKCNIKKINVKINYKN